jgi:hypothetical protein
MAGALCRRLGHCSWIGLFTSVPDERICSEVSKGGFVMSSTPSYEIPRFRLHRAATPSSSHTSSIFASALIDRRYLPGRGLLCSLLVHGMTLSGLLLLSLSARSAQQYLPRLRVTTINLRDPNYRLYLPILLGADPGLAIPKEGINSHQGPIAASARGVKGFSYPGPQPFISDVPNPTNRVQTVLQPALENPPSLPPPLLLPNVVRLVDDVPAPVPFPAEKQPIAAPVEPSLKPIAAPAKSAMPPVAMPKVLLPRSVAPELPEPAIPPPPPPPNSPVPKESNPVEASPKPVEPLLALSPMPAPPDDRVKPPNGEARGRFAVSPEPNLAARDTEPGFNVGTASSTGSRTAPNTRGASTGSVAPGTNDQPPGKAAGGDKAAPTGSKAGNGKAAFPGITILGSSSGTGTGGGNIISIGGTPPPLQTSYGITIVSTETSGGGLPKFGVFSDEQIYSVYVDMRRTVSDSAPSWTFEYAVPKGSAAATAKNVSRTQQGLVLPFPVAKEEPAFPAELQRKYLGQRIIVFAIINIDGKFEQVSVKESPDPLLNEFVISAMSKWAFRPAQLDGETVPVKALFGIPLTTYRAP